MFRLQMPYKILCLFPLTGIRKVRVCNFPLFRRSLSGYALQYNQYGDPSKVLEKVDISVEDDLKPEEVLLKMRAAPINPADINMIQGTYAIKPKLPAVGGNEGFFEVLKVGKSVSKLNIGSWVLPTLAGWGTWRTHAVCNEKELIEINNDLPVLGAATMAVNPCTSYRMLKDFVVLKPGDTIIQNGANSGVGQAVIQLAKAQELFTINIVRSRPDLDILKNNLISLGATYVVTEEELRQPIMEDIFKIIPKPVLALNCVGGKNALEMMRHLAYQGTMVTYGGMSRQPVTVPTSALIFKDIRVKGYWMTQWSKDNTKSVERTKMIHEISRMIQQGVLKPPPCRQVMLSDYKEAIAKSMQPYTSEKQILVTEEN